MLTKTSLKLVGRIVRMCHAVRVIPYQWNAKSFKLIPSTRSSIPGYIHLINIYIFTIYLIVRISALKTVVSPFKTTLIVVHFLYTLVSIMMSVIGTTMYLLKEDTRRFFNDFIQGYMAFGERYCPEDPKKIKSARNATNAFLKLVSRVLPLLGIVNLIPFLKYNRYPFCYYSLLLPHIGKSYILIISFALFQTWIIITMTLLGLFYMCILFPQIFVSYEIIKHLKVPKNTEGSKKIYPTPEEIPLILRQMQIIANAFDQCVASSIVPVLVGCMMTLNILGNYCAIALPFSQRPVEKIMMIYFSCITVIFNTVIYLLGGKVFKVSTAMLRSWRIKPGNSKYLQKVLKSCRPQKVKVGMFYFIRLNNVLTASNRVINYTGKVLIWTGFGK